MEIKIYNTKILDKFGIKVYMLFQAIFISRSIKPPFQRLAIMDKSPITLPQEPHSTALSFSPMLFLIPLFLCLLCFSFSPSRERKKTELSFLLSVSFSISIEESAEGSLYKGDEHVSFLSHITGNGQQTTNKCVPINFILWLGKNVSRYLLQQRNPIR